MKQINIPKALLKKLEALNPQLTNDLTTNIGIYNDYIAKVPSNHTWEFKSWIVMLEEEKKIKQDQDYFLNYNKLKWTDRKHSIRAIEHLALYRSNTLLNSTITNLIDDHFLESAILARSLFELCIWHFRYSSWIELNTQSIPVDPTLQQIGNTELDEAIAKLIFGSNEKGVDKELKQVRILEILAEIDKKLNKKGSYVDIEKNYDFLSEFAHPNAAGNNLFIKNRDIRAEKNQLVTNYIGLSDIQNDQKTSKVTMQVAEVVDWCIDAVISTSQLYEQSLRHINKNFKMNITSFH